MACNEVKNPGEWWTRGCAAYLAHVLLAFHFFHHWSHAAAYADTARQTTAVTGWNWGGGLYVNYAFTAAWVADVLWWWRGGRACKGCVNGIACARRLCEFARMVAAMPRSHAMRKPITTGCRASCWSHLWFAFGALFLPWLARAAETSDAPPVSIPVKFQRGHLMVPASVNGSNSLSFLLDTGYGINMIHPALVEPLGLTRKGRITIIGIAGREEAGQYEGAVFDLGGVAYTPRRIASLPSEAGMSRRKRDGVLGAGFFRRFVVEIDSQAATLRLHEPKTYEYTGKGEILPLTFTADTPIIDAALVYPNREPVRGRFEVDTGCDDMLCLGQEFVALNKLLEDATGTSGGVKQGVGGGASIRHGTVPQLQLGKLALDKVSANFFTEGSPAADGLAGHIGLAAWRKYRVIFDYSRLRMILETYP